MMMATKQKPINPRTALMSRSERRVAMRYARALMADTKLPGNSTLAVIGAGYDGAMAAARAICGVTLLGNRRSDLETLLDAANKLCLDEAWRTTASEQVKRYNRETRLFGVRDELPTEIDATRTVRWAETLYSAAVTHLRQVDPGLL